MHAVRLPRQVLDVTRCGLGEGGAMALGRVLGAGTGAGASLQELSASWNSFGHQVRTQWLAIKIQLPKNGVY